MSTPAHTYEPTCSFYTEPDAARVSGAPESSDPPKAIAQFFYTSFLPIDDPLSPLPPTSSDAWTTYANVPPQPFSTRDNAALEEAWQGFQGQSSNQESVSPIPHKAKFFSGRGGPSSSSTPRDKKAALTEGSVESSEEDSQDSGEILKDFLKDKKGRSGPFSRLKGKHTDKKDLDTATKVPRKNDNALTEPESLGNELKVGLADLISAIESVQQQIAAIKGRKRPLRVPQLKEAMEKLDSYLRAASATETTDEGFQNLEDDLRSNLKNVQDVLRKAHGRKDNSHQEDHDIRTVLLIVENLVREADDTSSLLERTYLPEQTAPSSQKPQKEDDAGKQGKYPSLQILQQPPAEQDEDEILDPREATGCDRAVGNTGESHVMLCDDPDHLAKADKPINKTELADQGSETPVSKTRRRSPFRKRSKLTNASSLPSPHTETPRNEATIDPKTSGFPFKRVASRRHKSPLRTDGAAEYTSDDQIGPQISTLNQPEPHRPELATASGSSRPKRQQLGFSWAGRLSSKTSYKTSSSHNLPIHDSFHKSKNRKAKSAVMESHQNASPAFVPVGVSRLHLVEIHEMLMKPIYWNPINDISSVLRGTWFYKHNMQPVEPDVANQLESGYEYMKPWTDAWQEELASCVDIGAEAELKVVHRLWPKEHSGSSRPGTSIDQEVDQQTSIEDEQEPVRPENRAVGTLTGGPGDEKLYKNSGVVYVDVKDAQILKPSLLPSTSRNRQPLKSIRKGTQIGLAVIRGFDRAAWDKLHPPSKMSTTAANAKLGAFMSQSGDAATATRRSNCPACRLEEDRPKVTDLILVIHGIGQKLSERVDSYHFTHAINAFRRQVNVELAKEGVSGNLRRDLGGIMVLPINWRLTFSFDDDTDVQSYQDDPTQNRYGLADITPDTLPAIRNLVSDVMLDIPYYLSHHKQKMIAAVIKEANRVYRLWCRNNTGFDETGRVHLIAHSLGSAMTMDILSQQPTKLPRQLDLKSKHVSDTVFEFNTKNLFFCGSPAGFFLLLNKANLLPRKGRERPDIDGDEMAKGITGDAGTYGCLAVDNVYNIMHENDPIAYRLNAAVDKDYAASLESATIPSSHVSIFQSIFRWASPPPVLSAAATSQRPNMVKLPSTVEMETHDFSREEIAEKRMYLLNENGQVDYFLSSGGGPLEIQYLNMLSAHSSYWTLQDFVRFLVVETGRTPGRDNTIAPFRVRKKRVIKAGKIA